jgi:hypothetical protein
MFARQEQEQEQEQEGPGARGARPHQAKYPEPTQTNPGHQGAGRMCRPCAGLGLVWRALAPLGLGPWCLVVGVGGLRVETLLASPTAWPQGTGRMGRPCVLRLSDFLGAAGARR